MRPPQADDEPGERHNRPIVTDYSGGDEDKSTEGRLRQMLLAVGQDFCPRCKSLGSANTCVDRLVGAAGSKKATSDHPERHQWYRAYGCLVAPIAGKSTAQSARDAAVVLAEVKRLLAEASARMPAGAPGVNEVVGAMREVNAALVAASEWCAAPSNSEKARIWQEGAEYALHGIRVCDMGDLASRNPYGPGIG